MKIRAVAYAQVDERARRAWEALATLGTVAGVESAAGQRVAEAVAGPGWEFYTDDGRGYQSEKLLGVNDYGDAKVSYEYTNGMPRDHYLGRGNLTYRAERGGVAWVYARVCDAWGPV